MSAKMRSVGSSILKRALVPAVAMATVTSFIACSPSKWKENAHAPVTAAKTGDPVAEKQKAPLNLNNVIPGKPVVVVPDQLPAQPKPNDNLDTSDITYEKGDILMPTGPAVDGKVPVVAVRTREAVVPQGPRYVPKEYLATQPVPATPHQRAARKYFVIQNIATQKLRVYERCEAKNCANKLILETEMVAGEDTPDHRSLLGSFRITEWLKFYEDSAHLFPSYYNAAYPALPAAGADFAAWTSKSLLPQGRGLVRGSFGWYTAKIGPDPTDEQWMHGTWGRAADGDKFIRIMQKSPANHLPDLASHGCTRVENQAIAFMREILPIDTPVIKVYAMEKISDGAQIAAQDSEQNGVQPFDWILTKNRTDMGAPRNEQIIEQGRYIPNTIPHAVNFGEEMSNLYGVPAEDMHGYLLVDQGRLVNYGHPEVLKVGGNKPYNYIPTMALSGAPFHAIVRIQEPIPLPAARRPIVKLSKKHRHGPLMIRPRRRPLRLHRVPVKIKVAPAKHKVVLMPRPRPKSIRVIHKKKATRPVAHKPVVQKASHELRQKPATHVVRKPVLPQVDRVTVRKPPPVPVERPRVKAKADKTLKEKLQEPQPTIPAATRVVTPTPKKPVAPNTPPEGIYDP